MVLAVLRSRYGRMQRRNSVFEVPGVKWLANIQDDIACKGVCVYEKHSRNRERRPAYSSSGSGSGVVLRHRAVAAACACLTVDAAAAAAYCKPDGVAPIRPWLSAQ